MDARPINPGENLYDPYRTLALAILNQTYQEAKTHGDREAIAFMMTQRGGRLTTALGECDQEYLRLFFSVVSKEQRAEAEALLDWIKSINGVAMLYNIDENHHEIFDTFKSLGASFHDTADQGGGFPDGVVGLHGATVISNQYTRKEIETALHQAGLLGVKVIEGANLLVEVKSSKKAPLTSDQQRWHRFWDGQIAIVWNIQQVLNLIPWARS